LGDYIDETFHDGTVWGNYIDETRHKIFSQNQINAVWEEICKFNWHNMSMSKCARSIDPKCPSHNIKSAFHELICEYLSTEDMKKSDIIYRKHVRFYAIVTMAMTCWRQCCSTNLPSKMEELVSPPQWGSAKLLDWSDCYQHFRSYMDSTKIVYMTTSLDVSWNLQSKTTCMEDSRELCEYSCIVPMDH
jgi:hypothetical protein